MKLKTCPFCGGSASIGSDYDDYDTCWKFVKCSNCGLRTRGKWYTHGNDCPVFYAEVRGEWNDRLDNPNDDSDFITKTVDIPKEHEEAFDHYVKGLMG